MKPKAHDKSLDTGLTIGAHILSPREPPEANPPTPPPPATSHATPSTPPTAHSRSKLQITLILLALFLSLFVAALDSTIVATAAPVICSELHSATGYIWIGAAYLIASAVGAPIWAKLSDIWGRRMVMLAAIAMFATASAVCGSAREMRVLIFGRSLQGVASGGLMLLVHVVISDLFSMRQRSLLMGFTEGVWALAGGLGPPLGGIFASLASWRYCFFLNLPLCAIAFVLLLLFLDVQHEKTSFRTGLNAVDWWGLLTFLAFTLMMLLGLDFGGVVYAWSSAKVICLIVVGVCMLGAFIYSEKRAQQPLIPLALFKDKSNMAVLTVAAVHGSMPAEYYMPLYLQSAKQRSPVMSGVLLIPLVVATALTGVVSGMVIHKTGRYKELLWIGTALLTAGAGSFIAFEADSSIGQIIGLTIFFGLGSGMLFEAPLIALQTSVKQQDIATATSTLNFVRVLFVAISVIVGGTVFQNSMDQQSEHLVKVVGLSPSIAEEFTGNAAAANVALVAQIMDPVQQDAVKKAYAWAIRNMWIMFTGVAAIGLLASMFVTTSKLDSDHVETVTGIKSDKARGGDDIEMIAPQHPAV